LIPSKVFTNCILSYHKPRIINYYRSFLVIN
jgi:hypothetical protein